MDYEFFCTIDENNEEYGYPPTYTVEMWALYETKDGYWETLKLDEVKAEPMEIYLSLTNLEF